MNMALRALLLVDLMALFQGGIRLPAHLSDLRCRFRRGNRLEILTTDPSQYSTSTSSQKSFLQNHTLTILFSDSKTGGPRSYFFKKEISAVIGR